MLRIGVFDGSFSPPHNGHIMAAKAFMEQMWLDFLYVLPSPARSQTTISDADRLQLCRMAFGTLEGVYVSDEWMRGDCDGILTFLRELCGEDRRLFLLCGTDRMLTLGDSPDAEELFRLCYPVYVRREANKHLDARIVRTVAENQAKYGKVMRRIVTDPLEFSSSQIRSALKKGEPVSKMLPEAVETAIRNNHLYV